MDTAITSDGVCLQANNWFQFHVIVGVLNCSLTLLVASQIVWFLYSTQTSCPQCPTYKPLSWLWHTKHPSVMEEGIGTFNFCIHHTQRKMLSFTNSSNCTYRIFYSIFISVLSLRFKNQSNCGETLFVLFCVSPYSPYLYNSYINKLTEAQNDYAPIAELLLSLEMKRAAVGSSIISIT